MGSNTSKRLFRLEIPTSLFEQLYHIWVKNGMEAPFRVKRSDEEGYIYVDTRCVNLVSDVTKAERGIGITILEF